MSTMPEPQRHLLVADDVRAPSSGRRTVVALHAHPDDESLLTGGTLAGLSAAGHRVVLVTATDGAAGLTDADHRDGLGSTRTGELLDAARCLGVHEVICLGHTDSGSDVRHLDPNGFSQQPLEPVAQLVAGLLRELDADLLIGYDSGGGYGHPDHVMVHRVGARAAALVGCAYVESTVPRRVMGRLMTVVRATPVLRRLTPPTPASDTPWSGDEAITCRVDVRRQVRAKQQALRAHRSQMGGGLRTVSVLAGLPHPLALAVLGREWYAGPGPVGAASGDAEALLVAQVTVR